MAAQRLLLRSNDNALPPSRSPMHYRLATIVVMLLLQPAPSLADEETADFAAELKGLAERYRISIDFTELDFPVKTTHGLIAGETAEAAQVEKYSKLLLRELGLYPVELVEKTRLKRIVLCRELSFAGQRRTAIPDFEHDVLYLDVARTSNKRFYLDKVFHHEFYHIVDLRDNGKLYEDERWKALNRDDFEYGNGGKNAQHLTDTSLLTAEYPGFLNHYSTTGVEEDKAELFANLIVEPKYVEEQAAKDPVLRAKVECLKAQLQAFCAEVDPEFWKRVNAVDRLLGVP